MIVKFIIEILDFFLLKPFFRKYFTMRIDALMLNNLSRKGLAVVTFNKKGKIYYGFVFKYPYAKKVVVNGDSFDLLYPNLIHKLIFVSKKQGA